MPAVSIVVPMYDVEPYVEECLESIAAQSHRDLEIVIVDDGSTDSSPAIAERFAERDGRARIIRQANQGLGRARNVGLENAVGDLVWFVDSDDVLPPTAVELLRDSLERTGSDFATGNVNRYDGTATWPAPFLKKAFSRNRKRTHITKFQWLVSDRVAWNKLWRRSFLEQHELRFVEGAYHEDIPMVIRAHFLASAVDVVSQPIYWWRERDAGSTSITQRRTDVRLLLDRVSAVEEVRSFLTDDQARRWYDESIVAEDYRYHLDVLDIAGDEYRAVFMDRANAFLDDAGEGIEDGLPPIQRLKWHLVRRRMLPELIEVLEFERDGFRSKPRTVRGGRVYGDYPFLDDERLNIPRSVYRLDTSRRRIKQAVTYLKP